jgi:hypothetical protein
MQVVMNIDSAENLVVKSFIENQVKFPADFKTQICEEDEMYLYSLSNVDQDADRALVRYYAIGNRILDSVKQIIEWHFDGWENVSSFLDFACGYGRFTRFLIQELPPAKRISTPRQLSFNKNPLKSMGLFLQKILKIM